MLNSIYDIKHPKDLSKLSKDKLIFLINETRDLIIKESKTHGGHIGANLSVIELSLALIKNLNLLKDKVFWDIGHNTYAWKIFTGRASEMKNLRELNGIKGFQNFEESPFDHVEQGNAGTAPSIALGYAATAKKDQTVITVIGDQSIANGTAMELLNHAHMIKHPLIIIINDNKSGIGPNVGKLCSLTTKDSFKKLADLFNFNFIGNVDGHNIDELDLAIKKAIKSNKHTFVHVNTIKGYGISEYEKDNGGKSHQVGRPNSLPKWNVYTSKIISDLMKKDKKVCLVSAAMTYPSNLYNIFSEYPDRCFDVGIAEEHGVAFAAGLALNGMKPIIIIQSCFLRRAYDQILQETILMNLPVTFLIEDADIVENGSINHGFYDIKMFEGFYNNKILSPSNLEEMKIALDICMKNTTGVMVVRHAKNIYPFQLKQIPSATKIQIEKHKWIISNPNSSKIIISHGNTFAKIKQIIDENDYEIAYVNAIWLKPLDIVTINQILKKYKTIILAEQNMDSCGLDSLIANKFDITRFEKWNLPHKKIAFGKIEDIENQYNISYKNLELRIKDLDKK